MAEVTGYNRVTENGRRRYVKPTKKFQRGNFFLRYRHNGRRVWESAGQYLSPARALACERQAQLLREENLPSPNRRRGGLRSRSSR